MSATPSTSDAHDPPSSVAQTNLEILQALPSWLRPGVSPTIHLTLKVVLLCLNLLLLTCVVLRVLSPHFEVMFLLSFALTICYFVFMGEIAKIHRLAHGAMTTTEQSEEEQKKNE